MLRASSSPFRSLSRSSRGLLSPDPSSFRSSPFFLDKTENRAPVLSPWAAPFFPPGAPAGFSVREWQVLSRSSSFSSFAPVSLLAAVPPQPLIPFFPDPLSRDPLPGRSGFSCPPVLPLLPYPHFYKNAESFPHNPPDSPSAAGVLRQC